MAVMHPSELNEIVFNADSEKEVYLALQAQLNSDVHVYYSQNWQCEIDGKIKISEADFIIVDPDYGYMVLEVKGGYKITYNKNWVLYDSPGNCRSLNKSPYKQASDSRFNFQKAYRQKYMSDFGGISASAVMFPHYDVPSDLSPETTEDNTIQKKDMSNLRKKIAVAFNACTFGQKGPTMSDTTRFMNLLEGCASSKPAYSALCQKNNDELLSMPSITNIVSLLHFYHRALFIGPAGTGKTSLAIMKAEEFASDGMATLYVCFNYLNAYQVQQYFAKRGLNVKCSTFHGLVARYYGGHAPIDLPDLRERLNVANVPKYDAILIDEAQDLKETWAAVLRDCFLRSADDSYLYVFCDEDQNIYDGHIGDVFAMPYPPFLLTQNMRNTSNIWSWITQETCLGKDAHANDVHGFQPQIYKSTTSYMAKNYIETRIAELLDDGIIPGDIVVLTDTVIKRSILKDTYEIHGAPLRDLATTPEVDSDCIKVCHAEAFKGLESSVVFYLCSKTQNDTKMLYVSASRARCLLYIVKY